MRSVMLLFTFACMAVRRSPAPTGSKIKLPKSVPYHPLSHFQGNKSFPITEFTIKTYIFWHKTLTCPHLAAMSGVSLLGAESMTTPAAACMSAGTGSCAPSRAAAAGCCRMPGH